MSDAIDRAAEIIESNLWVDGEHLAQALDDAGLLATPERDAEQRQAGAAEALRKAAEKYREADRNGYLFLAGNRPVPWDAVANDLCADADRIEAQR